MLDKSKIHEVSGVLYIEIEKHHTHREIGAGELGSELKRLEHVCSFESHIFASPVDWSVV